MSTSPSQRFSSPDIATTTMANTNDDDAQQFQQIIRDRKDEREDVQKKAFTKWINNQLANTSSTPAVTDLYHDLRDGVVLLRLLEALTGNEYKRENGKMRVHHIGNVNKVIAVLAEHGIKLLSISSNDIVDGHPKLTLALIWSIIQYWQVKDVLKSVVPDTQPSTIEKFLLAWCQDQTKGYKGVEIKDFTRSWQDGLAFNALIHKFRPDLFDYEEILQNASARNLEHAFSVAKNVFKIDRYLDVEDVLSEYPDKKSILMYIMCLFQQLPTNNIVIEDKEKIYSRTPSRQTSTTTTMTTSDIMTDTSTPKETKSPSSTITPSSPVPVSTMRKSPPTSPLSSKSLIELTTYQTNMEKILQWILKLEDQLDNQDKIISTDLKFVKEQFQNHEDFMISLTKDQNQIGEVLQEGNRLLTKSEIHLQPYEENEIKEQMKILNRRWESLRSKSLDRQSILHKTLMKLQIDQIESFDAWLTQAEQRISTQLDPMEQELSGIDRQYRQLAQLQDELVAQQQITESLQNMVIVIDDSVSSNDETSKSLPSKYSSIEIEAKLLNLSERWAHICNFVQNRWIQLQEVKIELEQVELNRDKVDRWLTRKEQEIIQMKTETNITDADILMQQVHSIQKTETEMDDIRQSILALDNSLKVLSMHYDSGSSLQLKKLNEQVNGFEKRWTSLIEDLEQCSARLKSSHLNFETSVQTSVKPESDIVRKTITTTVEETTTTYSKSNSSDKIKDDSMANKKRKITNSDSGIKRDFDLSARKYTDWIDNIERILDDRTSTNLNLTDRQEIVQEVKNKFLSYDDQFKNLIQTGNIITQQFKDANEDPSEHESSLRTLERRWHALHAQILECERDIERLGTSSKFEDEFQTLDNARSEYQTWLDSTTSSTYTTEAQVKLKSFQSYNERLANLQRMASRLDANATQRVDNLLRSWDNTHARLRERSIPVEHMQQSSSETIGSSVFTRQTGTTSLPTSPNRTLVGEHPTTTTTTSPSINPSIGENGSVFTLTNIYTFGDGGNINGSSSQAANNISDKYRVKSFVEVFEPTTQQETDFERFVRETHHTSSSVTRKTRTSASDTIDYGRPIGSDSRYHHHYESTTSPTSTRPIAEHRPDDYTISSGTETLSSLPASFTDIQRKLRLWLEHVEQSLLADKVRTSDLQAMDAKKRTYKDLLDQTFEQEHNMEYLHEIAREYYSKLTLDISRRLQEELTNYQDRLYDVKMFLSERLAKYNRLDKTLSDFERGVDEVKQWIRNAQPRLAMDSATHGDSRVLENQLGRSQILQHEIREMQTTLNRLNKDVVDLTQDADEKLARRLREEMRELNESWSHIISSTKVYSQHIQDALKRNKALHESIQEMEDWILDKEREAPADDGPIFYQDQLRERLEQYQKLQNELTIKEHIVRRLVEQGRQDLSTSSSTPDLAQSLETLVSNWSNLQKKVDAKVAFYNDVYDLHENLKNLLHQESVWLDTLQEKIFSSTNGGADAEEISEELDILERFVKTHSKSNYENIFEIADRLQATKVSLPSTTSQINQFRIRWEQLHDDAFKKIHTLNSQISDYQHMGHQITAMFEWMRHTDNTLNSRLKDDVYADDVPGEAEKLIVEFNQYEALLRSIEDKVHSLRSAGKSEAAKRLEQQLIILKNQFGQLQTKFRHFQKPSDFEPKYAKMRQILLELEQNLHGLEIRSDDPDVIHSQLEHCIKLYKTLSDIKSEVEYVIRTGRGIVEKRQSDEPNDLTRQIDQLKASYNNLGSKVSSSKTQLDNVERHLRKFRKEYSHVHEWLVKADNEIRKIENKQVSKNTKEEVDWIRTTRNDIKKLEANFETLRNLERTIQKEADRQLPNLHEKIVDLKRQIDQLDRRLKDRSEIVEGQVRKLEDDYLKFNQIYQEIIIRLDKLEILLSDAERVLDLTRISQVQDELRNVRSQLDELLTIGQELVSKSEKYSKLVGPDIETITRKFEDLQRRIRYIQERPIRDRPEYEEIEKIIRETEERAYIIEKTDVEQGRRIREKIRRLRDYLDTLKHRSNQYQETSDEVVRYNERYEERIRTTDRTVPKEREFDSDFIYDVDDTRSVISEPAPQYNTKFRKTVHSLERYKMDDQYRHMHVPNEEYQLQPLLRVRSLKAIDHRTLSAPSSPILQPRYRSYERSNIQYTKQSTNQQGQTDNYQSSIAKSASMPNGGFPIQHHLPPPPAPPIFLPQQPMIYRERVIDRHVAEQSKSHGESHRQHQQQESSSGMQQQQQNIRSASASGTQTLNRSIPVRYETAVAGGGSSGAASSSYRQASNGYAHEQYPSHYYNEQYHGGGGNYRQQQQQQQPYFDQPAYPPQPVGRHPTRIAN